jgi:hypothetical protein
MKDLQSFDTGSNPVGSIVSISIDFSTISACQSMNSLLDDRDTLQ